MLFVVLLALAVTPAVATDLTYTGQKIVINQPGTYVLKNDIQNSNHLICIEIQASNVVFDGGGHTIDGVRGEGTAGIYVHGLSAALSGVTIRNLKVQDWYYGIYLHETKSSTIEAATLSGNTFTGAVAYKGATGNTVKNSIITGNLYGLIFSDGAAGGVISNNEIKQNDQGLYIYLSDGITVTGNRITDNTNTGIQLRASGNGSIYNNRFFNNLNVAFSGEPFKANTWSVTPGAADWSPANIIGGPKVGGNYWGRPDNTGWSQANADLNLDGFIDDPFTIAEGNADNFPLAIYTGPTPTATPTPTVTPTPPVGQQGPYRSVTVPARVEAENYDTGGENVAYHDVEVANLGKAYRTTEGVDVESAGGVTNIAYIRAGEWTEYTVNVPATGTYPVTFRVASPNAGRQIQVSVNGVPKATVSVPNSASFTSWRSVTVPVALDAGTPVIRLAYPVSSMNLDWFEFGAATGGQNPTVTPTISTTVTPTVSTTVTPQAGQSPYNGPHALPGTVQAEDYDNGGLSVAYWDSTTGNKAVSTAGAVAYRPNEHVDAETVGGGSNIGWITDGEWTEYTVSVATAGTYTANFRVGSWETGSRQIRVSVDGVERATVNVPNTGSSTAYETVSATLALPAGSPVIRLRFVGAKQNIDWFSVTGGPEPTQSVTPTVTETPTVTVTPTATVTPDPSGQAAYKPHNAPVRVEAEDYDEGGPGVAYSDTTADNQGLAYRLVEGVDVEPTSGGFNIGYIKSGEWVEYTVNIPAAGTYPTTFRVASWYATEGARSISVSIGGVTAKGTVNVPLTNADTAYQTVTVPLALDAGPQVIRLTFNGARQNIDWFEIGAGAGQTPTPSVTATPTATPTPTPSTGIPGVRTIPGRVEAEMYDAGPSGAAYRDYNPVNNLVNLGNWKVRDPTGVDLYSSGSVVYVGSIESWEWMEYTVNVVEEGDYTVDFRACSWSTTSTPYPDKPSIVWDPTKRVIQLRVDSPTYDYVVPVTASATAFQTGRLSSTIHLTPGTHELGVMFLGKNQNFDYMEFNRVSY